MYRTGSPDPLISGRRLEWMAGARRRSLYFETPSGSQVKEWAVSAGLGIPVPSGAFRYVLEVGGRGDVASQGVSERFYLHTLSFSGWLR